MSRKHNTKHNRTVSRYPLRLIARGISNTQVRMADLPSLRRSAELREKQEVAAALDAELDGM